MGTPKCRGTINIWICHLPLFHSLTLFLMTTHYHFVIAPLKKQVSNFLFSESLSHSIIEKLKMFRWVLSINMYCIRKKNWGLLNILFNIIIFKIYLNWRLITLQYCGGFCHRWYESATAAHVPPLQTPSHLLPPHPIPLDFPSTLALSACFIHQTWTGPLFHIW